MKLHNTNSTPKKVRVRFAPSPTGYLHVGGARTALYDYLFAQKFGGEFILRIEDTDEERSKDEYMWSQLEDLKWLGLTWSEGPQVETQKETGDLGPYQQKYRLEIYKKYIDQLLDQGQAYYCFLTEGELDQQREVAKKNKLPFRPLSPSRDWSKDKALAHTKENQLQPTVRFKNNFKNKKFEFKDLVRGDMSFPSDMIGDFVIQRSSGMPVYNFVCTIDDALMKISHVFRAEEHLSNTLKQLMIYETLGFDRPEFAHLSIMLGEDRQKLSKRHGATSVSQFKEEGYLPEALTNFIALMGWSSPSGEEILSQKEMIDNFSSDRFNSASSVFDPEKLKWMNAQYLRKLEHQDLWQRLQVFFDKEHLKLPQDKTWVDMALETFKSSMETLKDAVELFRPICPDHFKLEDSASEVMAWETTAKVLEYWKSEVSNYPHDYLSAEDFKALTKKIQKDCEVKGKPLFMPLRVALIGAPQGVELAKLIPLLSRQEILRRVSVVLGV